MGDFEVRVTEEEVRESEEYEAGSADETLAAVARDDHAVPDRARARELFERLATLPEGDPERERIRGALVELHLPLVEYLARRFRNRGEWLDDLTQVATIGLIKSIDRFDLERGVEFSTYATPTIVGEIKRHFRDKGWAVRVPRRLQELKLSLTKAISDLAQREGRAPTVSELAAHLRMSEEEVLEGLESANAYSTVSLDAPDSGDEDAPAVADSLGIVDEALEGVEYRESLKPLLERLPPREKKILLLRFFGNMTQSQIAAELGISQMHVSRLLARTLTQLRAGLTSDELSGLARLPLARRGAAARRPVPRRGPALAAGLAPVRPGEGAHAGRQQQTAEGGQRDQQHGQAQREVVILGQVEPGAADEQLGQQGRRPAPPAEPGQADRDEGDQHGRAEADHRQGDAAGLVV
jgi:RNA polymerase sigma-B factor